MSQKLAQLKGAMKQKGLVRFARPFEEGVVEGYVLDIGPQFFVLAVLDEYVRFNGFSCFRFSDVRRLQVPAPHAAFCEAALVKRGLWIPPNPAVDVSSLRDLLATANHAFPLVTIHLEKKKPDVCYIGRVVDLSREGYVSLLEISPDARWDDKPTEYRLSDITRVDFGGGYEEALYLVGGLPRTSKLPSKKKRR